MDFLFFPRSGSAVGTLAPRFGGRGPTLGIAFGRFFFSMKISTVEGKNVGTPFLLIIPEGARARVRTRTRVRVRARTRNGGSAARCSNRWSWP